MLIFQEIRAANKKLLKTADMNFNILNNVLGVLERLEKAESVPALPVIAGALSKAAGEDQGEGHGIC